MIRRLKFPYKKISFIGLISKMPRLKWKNIIFLMEKKRIKGKVKKKQRGGGEGGGKKAEDICKHLRNENKLNLANYQI